jgi:hypothetical protein
LLGFSREILERATADGRMKAIGLLLAGTILLLGGGAQAATATRDICRLAAAQQEKTANIPQHLLYALSLAETGRWDDERRESYAWPWTVTSGGAGKNFPTREAAIAEVRRLKAKGITNIDVGCMQVNLGHHGDAFGTIEHAFDPAANMAYAASFLRQLFEETGSWTQATAYYHSRTPEKGEYYKSKVARLWDRVRNGGPRPVEAEEADTVQLASSVPAGTAATAGARAWVPPRSRIMRSAATDVALDRRAAATAQPPAVPVATDHPLRTASVPADEASATVSLDRDAQHRQEMETWREAQVSGADASHVALMQRVRKDLERKDELWQSQRGGEGGSDRFASRRRAQLAAWRASQM